MGLVNKSRIVGLLESARDHIAQTGMWMQGNYSDQGMSGAVDGLPCCATGALLWAVGNTYSSVSTLVDVLNTAVRRADLDDEPLEIYHIVEFNDYRKRTQDEVVNIFGAAILIAKEWEV